MARGVRPGVRLNLRDSQRIRRFLEQLDPDTRNSVVPEALESIARLTEARAKEVEIVRGRGLTSPPLKDRLSYRTGHLTRSISTDTSGAPRLYVVGTSVRYGPVHELPIPPYPKRAFLEPAAVHVIASNAHEVFVKALKRARSSA